MSSSGIADITFFYPHPEIYAYGMVCALSVGFAWQLLASIYGYNVSATHSIIGGILGFSLCFGGADAVIKGIVPIILSWFFSPVLTAACSALLFWIVRTIVLRRENAYKLSFWVLPPFVILTTWINIYFVFTKGAKKSLSSSDEWTDNKAAWIAACCAAGLGFVTAVVILPILKFRADKFFSDQEKAVEAGVKEEIEVEIEPTTKWGIFWFKLKKAIGHGMNVDVHAGIEDDPIVSSIHEAAEVFDPKAEFAFSYLQVFSAICVIFSHGAGEVGYMAGPLSCIWDVYRQGVLKSKTNAPIWIIIISAFGLVVGLATYGYNVTRAVGTQMAKLSPSRGFAAELSTACVIMVAAQYGLPTSSSQCITGGIVGVGMVDGVRTGVNWGFFARTFASWISTLFLVGILTAALFAQGVFAPSLTCDKAVQRYETGLVNTAQGIYKEYNATLYKFKPDVDAGALSTLNKTHWASLNKTLASAISSGKNMLTYKKQGTITPDQALGYLYKSLSLTQQYSINTLGQNKVYRSAKECNDGTLNTTIPEYNKACTSPNLFKQVYAPHNSTSVFKA